MKTKLNVFYIALLVGVVSVLLGVFIARSHPFKAKETQQAPTPVADSVKKSPSSTSVELIFDPNYFRLIRRNDTVFITMVQHKIGKE